MKKLYDVRVAKRLPLAPPSVLRALHRPTQWSMQTVLQARETIEGILKGEDKRLLLVVGPCSIHDKDAAIEYAKNLKALAQQVNDTIFIVMRTYFEKPRTTNGWTGLITDPYLNGMVNLERGITLAREILNEITGLGVPTATEFLDPIVPDYIADLICWAAIGARTTESQTHRHLASGLSMPVGFKNSTTGESQIAINAMLAAREPHGFLGVNEDGRVSQNETQGNDMTHIILRGGGQASNYDAANIARVAQLLEQNGLASNIMIDCSHGNSKKDYRNQGSIFRNIVGQIVSNAQYIMGVMIESNLVEGKQSTSDYLNDPLYGVSITDGCIGWEETQSLILDAHQTLFNKVAIV